MKRPGLAVKQQNSRNPEARLGEAGEDDKCETKNGEDQEGDLRGLEG